MPRLAKTFQMASWCAPLADGLVGLEDRVALSRYDGLAGESSIARVTSDSVTLLPRTPRSSQSVSPQISPSACTSGRLRIRPKSP